MKRSGHIVVCASAIAVLAGLPVASAAAATSTAAPATAAPSCSDSYVVESSPLEDTATGQSSWSYGYVQLWYDGCTGDNWSRTVSLLAGTNSEWAQVYNTKPSSTPATCTSGVTVTVSENLYSPVLNAGAAGEVTARGVAYFAEADQSGASFANDASNGVCA